VPTDRLARLAERVLHDEAVSGDLEMTLLFVTEATIADFNLKFMGHEGPTDVLSFPIDEAMFTDRRGREPSGGGPGRPAPSPPDTPPAMLGDVVVCPAVARRNAPQHAGTYDDELALLVVHGVLHLLGRDHAADDERVAMQSRERVLLDAHWGPLSADPWGAT
jgi:probable rRNA maturation factor